jgi:Ca-activated chloride channel family protein
MTFDPDDPRLTAFALGELEGDERAAVEALIADNDEARRAVEETQALARLLVQRLQAEPAPGLAAEHHRAIEAQLAVPATLTLRPRWRRWARYAVAAGAVLFVGGVSYIAWQERQRRDQAAVEGMVREEARPADVVSRAPVVPPASAPEGARPHRWDERGPADRPIALGAELKPALDDAANAPERPPAPRAMSRAAGVDSLRHDTEDGGAVDGFAAGGVPAAAPATTAPAGAARMGRFAMPSPAAPPGAGGAAYGRDAGGGMGGMGMSTARAGSEPAASEAKFGEFRSGQKPGQSQAPPGQQQGQAQLGEATDFAVQFDREQATRLGAPVGQQQSGQQGLARSHQAGESRQRGLSAGQNEALFVKDQLADQQADAQKPGGAPAVPEAEGLRQAQADPQALAIVPAEPQEAAAKRRTPAAVFNAEKFPPLFENDPKAVTPLDNLSTFSVDVDTGSYTNIRRFLNQGLWPPPDAVRIEEMLNYFTYDYPEPRGETPFSVATEVTRCPWNPDHWLLRVGLKGRSVAFEQRQPSNLVFLVDVSGSMDEPDKLPLVKAALRMLVDQLGENDKITLVTYAGTERVAMRATAGHRKAEILAAIDQLGPGGSTNGEAGYKLAYDEAVANFIPGGINRVILATDGDFNVGLTDAGGLTRMAEEKAKSGVFLTVLGVGQGNLNEQNLEQMADKGNGHYRYLDSLLEARKVLVEEIGGTLVTIAKDVKIQLDFNPAKVGGYRQIGYENRQLAAADFRNDLKDAGEIGSGHTVTALYELIPPGDEAKRLAEAVEASKFVKPAEVADDAKLTDEMLVVRLRYKTPDGDQGIELKHPVADEVKDLGQATTETKFAASVAMFGLILRDSKYKGSSTLDATIELAEANKASDHGGYRSEFVELVKKAKTLPPR